MSQAYWCAKGLRAHIERISKDAEKLERDRQEAKEKEKDKAGKLTTNQK